MIIAKLLGNDIYKIGTVRADRKHMPSLKARNEMLCGKPVKLLSVTEWIDNKSDILLSNYHDPRFVNDIDKRVKEWKEKVKVSCPTVSYFV